MSGNGFDENPFGEPNLDNPFADPAIQQATRMSTNVSLEDYNPFEEQAKPQLQINSTNTAAVRRQEELDRKAAELDRREQQLQGNVPQLNNWPPLPDNFCVKPCFYQDFEVEIPPEFQRLVKHLYYIWMFYTLTLCANIIGGLILLFYAHKISNLFLAIFYTVLFTPASYVCCTGASMDKAKAEFTTEFLRNQHVQEAASSAVSSAVNSQFNNSRY
ncbi:Scamp [Drosophila busckii]|uniref:Secretory carrier-associated membrane protein n=1 Tax=Drosophila busckii TaxID=30019 RepID=A0A0M5J3E6_DROBS|nr:Scamp [Drosophila busckii]